jgi:hypothetical protein
MHYLRFLLKSYSGDEIKKCGIARGMEHPWGRKKFVHALVRKLRRREEK